MKRHSRYIYKQDNNRFRFAKFVNNCIDGLKFVFEFVLYFFKLKVIGKLYYYCYYYNYK